MNPFDYVKDASMQKKNLMRDTDNDELAEEGYSPFLTNKSFSMFLDTILHANIMNQYHFLDNRPQYEFYINSLEPRKRFASWLKATDDEDLDFVCGHYGCNRNVGKQYLSLLSSEDLQMMKEQQKTGGKENEHSGHISGGKTPNR